MSAKRNINCIDLKNMRLRLREMARLMPCDLEVRSQDQILETASPIVGVKVRYIYPPQTALGESLLH